MSKGEADKTERIKEEREIQFEQFSRHKLILAWRNLTLFASSSIFEMDSANLGSPRAILRNLSDQFRFSTMNALMGTSGAGKTTLLKVLNGRYKARLSGDTHFYLSNFTKIVTSFIHHTRSVWPFMARLDCCTNAHLRIAH